MTAHFTSATDPSGADLAAGLHFSVARNPDALASSYAAAGIAISASFALTTTACRSCTGESSTRTAGSQT